MRSVLVAGKHDIYRIRRLDPAMKWLIEIFSLTAFTISCLCSGESIETLIQAGKDREDNLDTTGHDWT